MRQMLRHRDSDPEHGKEDPLVALDVYVRGHEVEVFDSQTGWVAEHVRNYAETDGKKGHLYHGTPTLLLTSRGRKSGVLRRTALIYGRDGDSYVLVASNGGAPRRPAWYLSLVEHPDIEVQLGPDRFSARARPATAEERPKLWRTMASIFLRYDAYQKKAGWEIPVVVVERVG